MRNIPAQRQRKPESGPGVVNRLKICCRVRYTIYICNSEALEKCAPTFDVQNGEERFPRGPSAAKPSESSRDRSQSVDRPPLVIVRKEAAWLPSHPVLSISSEESTDIELSYFHWPKIRARRKEADEFAGLATIV
ncbi:unnamed protein product [Victoria cruziana]